MPIARAPLVLMLLAAAVLPAAAPPPPHRIVSLDLCADQYLIALADRAQIAGLSRFARNPDLSYFAVRARAYPAAGAGAEDVLTKRPDLVIGVPYRQRDALAPLATWGVRLIDLPPADDLAAIERTVVLIAGAVGHPERGRALIAAMHAELGGIGRPGRGRTAAYYQRRGYLTGTGTLVDEVFRRIGLVNLAARLGRPALSRLSVEQMALARPAFIVMESDSARVADRGTEMLRHPVLAGLPRLYLPQALTVCPGPSYPEAVSALAAAVRAADAGAMRAGAAARPVTRSGRR